MNTFTISSFPSKCKQKAEYFPLESSNDNAWKSVLQKVYISAIWRYAKREI